jgi:hypothetical protein
MELIFRVVSSKGTPTDKLSSQLDLLAPVAGLRAGGAARHGRTASKQTSSTRQPRNALAQSSVLRRYRAARRIRRAFARQAREQATPISGVITPGRPPS